MKENTKTTKDGKNGETSDVIDLQSIEREIEELKKEIQTYYLESPSGIKGMPDKIFVRDISELEEKITEHIPKKIVEDEIIIKNIIEQDGAAPTTKPIDFSRVREFEMPSEYRNEMFQGEVENIEGDTEYKNITPKGNKKEKNVTEDKRKIFLEDSNSKEEGINNFDIEETKQQSLEGNSEKGSMKEVTGKSAEQSLDIINTELTDISKELANLDGKNGTTANNMFTNIVYKTTGKISDTGNEIQEKEAVSHGEKSGRSNSKSAQDLLNDLLQSGVAKEEFHSETENLFGNIVDLKNVEDDKSQTFSKDDNEVNEAGVGIEELSQLASDLLEMSENKEVVPKNETKSDEKVNRVFVSKSNTISNENNKDSTKKEKSKKRSEKDGKNTKENTAEQNAKAVQAETDNEDKANVQMNVALNNSPNSPSKNDTDKRQIKNNLNTKMNTEKQNDKNIISKKHKIEENSVSEGTKEVKIKDDYVVSNGEADKKTKPRIKVESQEKDGLDLWKGSEEKIGLDKNMNDIDIEALEKLILEKSLNIKTKDNSGGKDINIREGIEDLLKNSDEKDLELRENIIPDVDYKNLDKEKKIDLAEQLLSELGEEESVRLKWKDSKNQKGKKSSVTKSSTQTEREAEEEGGIEVYDTQTLFSKKLEDVITETALETDEKPKTEIESDLLETVVEEQAIPMMAELLEELSKSEIINESQMMLERPETEELNINIDLSNSKSEIEKDIEVQSKSEMGANSFNESLMEAVMSELENSEFANEFEPSKNKKSVKTEVIEEETEGIVKEKEITKEIVKEIVKEKFITNTAVSVKQEKIEEPKKQNWLQRLKNKNSAAKNNISIQNEKQSTNVKLGQNAKDEMEVRQTETTESMLEVEFEKFSQDKAKIEITETAENKAEVEMVEKASNKIEVEVSEKASNKVEAEVIEDIQSEFEIEMAKAFSNKKTADVQNAEISQDKANETEMLQSAEDIISKKNEDEQIPILKDKSEVLDTDNVAVFKNKRNNKKKKKSGKQKKIDVAVVTEVKKEIEVEKTKTSNTKEKKKSKKSADKKDNSLSIFKSKKRKRRSLWEVIKESLAKFFKPKSEPKNVILLEVEEPFDKGETIDENNETNVFGVVNGNIQGNNIIINPKAIIKGDIQAIGKVICMEKSVITGDVSGEEIIVYGMVRGSIFGTKQVTVKVDAIVTMDIRCENIQVEENAVVQGNLLK
jgi:Integral membrane protein CcmA involved in cell shape determination